MSRAAYVVTDTVRALRLLVAFAESETPVADLPRDYWKGTRTGQHPLDWMLAGNALLRDRPVAELVRMTPTDIEALRRDLRAFLRFLAGDDQAWPGGKGMPTLDVELFPIRVKPGQVKWAINGPARDVLLYQTKTLLDRLEGGLDRLRQCPAPDCRRVFVKIGRRDYCSERCRQRVFLSTYDPFAAKPRRADRPTPAARVRRK